MSEPLDIQLFYIQTVRYLTSSSIPVLARSYSVILLESEAGYIHTNLEVFDEFLHSCVNSFVNVILVVSDPIDSHLFYVQTLRYLMSSSIPVLARSYSVILVVSEAAESRWGLELARRKSEEGAFQSPTLEELLPPGTSRLRLSSAASQRTRNPDLDREQSTNQSIMHTYTWHGINSIHSQRINHPPLHANRAHHSKPRNLYVPHRVQKEYH